MSAKCVNQCTISCKEFGAISGSGSGGWREENLSSTEPSPLLTPSEIPLKIVKQQKETDHYTAIDLKDVSKSNKVVFARLPIYKLWFVLILTFGFTVLLLVASHLTHSLTLRVEAYHALYNLMALCGCLFTMKIWERPSSIKNTFGWARVEILSCLCSLLFITSLCFSIALESVQTAAHAGHQDPMHHPLHIIAVAGIGLFLNAIVFFLIGGYTHHQGCFLERRSSGVWVQRRVNENAVQTGMRALLSDSSSREEVRTNTTYQGIRGIFRDTIGLFIVILCSAIVFWDSGGTFALYIDPGFAMISGSLLLYLSFPYGKECCQILLQTIPGNIDVHRFSAKLLQEFPEVINIHHLHIWSLTPGKAIATAHVVFSSPKVFHSSINALEQFFFKKNITKVTLQPEFMHYSSEHSSKVGSRECLIKCSNTLCREKECCDSCSMEITENGESSMENSLNYRYKAVSGFPAQSFNNVRLSTSEYHGTSAFRCSDIDLDIFKTGIRGRSKSEDDLMEIGALKTVLNIPKSKSCQSLVDETTLLVEKKSNIDYRSSKF